MVTCPSCARENPEDSKFCSECGAKLEDAPILGRSTVETRVLAAAALAALDGNLGEQLPALRDAMRATDELGDVLTYGMAALALLRVTGPDTPEVREFGERAMANFERMGAEALARQLRAALSAPTEDVRTAAAVTTTAAVS